MTTPYIASDVGILATLVGTCGFFFWVERATRWRLFNYLPPLIFIYALPVIFSNSGVLPAQSGVYESIKSFILPMMLVLLLLKVDVGAAIRVMGRGVFVMLCGTLGVVIGAPLAYLLVRGWLSPEGWKAFGTLAGSWIGGTGNMAGVSEMIDAEGTEFGLAVLGDTTIYLYWLPIMLGSKKLAGWFARFTNVDPQRLKRMERAAAELTRDDRAATLQDYLYLLFIALAATWVGDAAANHLPELKPFVSAGTWRILVITTLGILLSFTPARHIPGSHNFAMALVYIFVARMGASAELEGVTDQAFPFLVGASVWIFIHGGFCLLGAKLLRVDVHTAAIASAANIGGAASAPIVAAHHKESLVPASVLMALVGYAIGNYAGYLAAQLCRLVSLLPGG
jgi:uncharacterized membrane protein